MNKKIRIATILPYKENYTFNKASAASLWVSEFFKKSKYNKNNIIFGNTEYKNYLTKNYINIELKTLKSKFRSSTKEYSKNIIEHINNKKFDLIEIHNRPLIFRNIFKSITSKFIFYFHNDPLSMSGSKTINERLFILENVEKIIFVSKWCQKRFFINVDKKLIAKTEIIYPSINKSKKIKIKDKYITFVGRLNETKGYDLFEKAIIKILDNFPQWKAFSVGDEDRRKIFIEHKNHKELGFLTHKKVLNLLEKTEIAVIPSKWEEPFGRTALEASSKGCATIISNRGGLPETTDHAIILKRLDHDELFRKIKFLITNNSERKKIQKLSHKNVKHLIKVNSKLIDNTRERCVANFNINILKKRLKIMNIYNQGQKLNHRLYNISLGKNLQMVLLETNMMFWKLVTVIL